MSRPPRVLVVGDVAVDVLVRPSAEIAPGADVPARIRTAAGGAGANTAAWLAHHGADVALAARVGADAAGRAAAAELVAAGVRPVLAVDAGAPTCTVVVLVDGAGDRGSRTMLSDRGAAGRLEPADLPALDDVDHLHLSGYVLLDASSRAAGVAALAAARAAGVTTSVDPQVAHGPAVRELLHGIDLLLPDAAELAALGTAESLVAAGVAAAVAVTDGPGPARWTDARGTWSVSPPAARVVDVTGAGDAFDAGLITAWLGGAGPEEALRAGCAAGAAAVGTPGARPPR